jgi:hypothetical protein
MPDPILRPSDAENLAGVETGRAHLSHSRIGMFLACHRRYELHYEERLEPVSRPAALSMGSAFQKAIEFQEPDWAPMILDGYKVDPDDGFAHTWPLSPPAEPPFFHTQEAEDKHRINQAIVRAAAALYLRAGRRRSVRPASSSTGSGCGARGRAGIRRRLICRASPTG